MAKKYEDLEMEEVLSRRKKEKPKPSLSDYNQDLVLQPMREKEVLSRKDQKAKQLLINSAQENDAPLDMGFSKLFNYGKVINPSTPPEKKDTTGEAIKKMQSSDISTSAKGFMDLKGDAPQQKLPAQDSRQLMEDAKKQRKLRWADALTALGAGLQGKTYNRENAASTQIQKKRDAEFKEYKDIVKNNQAIKSAWDAKKNDDLISYVQKLKEEAKGEPTRLKQLEIQEQQLLNSKQQYRLNEDSSKLQKDEFEARKKGGYYDYRDRKPTSTGTEKITLPTSQERIINDVITVGSGEKTSAAFASRMRESIIKSLYDETTDAQGKTTFTPKPGAEAKIKSLADKTKQLSIMKARLDALEKSLENSLNPDPAEQQELKTLKENLPALQDELFGLIDDAGTPAVTGKTPFEEALEKAK